MHQCIKFIHEEKLTCVKDDLKQFQYCNFIPSYDDILSSIFLILISPSNVVPYNVVYLNEICSIVESSGKAIASYTCPHVGEYKLQDQSINLPNIDSIRYMGHHTQSSNSKEPFLC